jgi:hypothetical protein
MLYYNYLLLDFVFDLFAVEGFAFDLFAMEGFAFDLFAVEGFAFDLFVVPVLPFFGGVLLRDFDDLLFELATE